MYRHTSVFRIQLQSWVQASGIDLLTYPALRRAWSHSTKILKISGDAAKVGMTKHVGRITIREALYNVEGTVWFKNWCYAREVATERV